jgi:GxxExxY protein
MAVDKKFLHSDITHAILQAFFTVCRRLPFGLPLSFYKKALSIELKKLQLKAATDKEIIILYDKQAIGSLTVDLLVDNKVIVTTISADNIAATDEASLKNTLRLTDFEVGLILNFGIEGQHKRLVYTNDLKYN